MWYRRIRKLEAGLKSLKGLIASVYVRREGCSSEKDGHVKLLSAKAIASVFLRDNLVSTILYT